MLALRDMCLYQPNLHVFASKLDGAHLTVYVVGSKVDKQGICSGALHELGGPAVLIMGNTSPT